MLPIIYSSTDVGAPTLTSDPGALVAVLDACLVTGFNPHSVASITLAQGVATLTTNVAHGYKVGDFLSISAAAGFNGLHKVQTVPSTTSLTFLTAVSAADQGSGAQVKKAPLGWQKLFADGSTKAIYQSADVQAYGQCLVLDDTGVTGHFFGAEAASAIDNYSNPFPAAGLYWPKASEWFLVGDGRIFYFFCNGALGVFGDVESWQQGDAFGAILSGENAPNSGYGFYGSDLFNHNAFSGSGYAGRSVICRNYTGLTMSCPVASVQLGSPSDGGLKTLKYPSPIDSGAVFLGPTFITEQIANQGPAVRGILPGVADFFAKADSLAQSQTIAATDGSGETFFVYKILGAYTFSIRISSAWRDS